MAPRAPWIAALAVLAAVCSVSAAGHADNVRRWRSDASKAAAAGTRRLTHDDLVAAARRDPEVLGVMDRQCTGSEAEGEKVVDNTAAAASCHMLGRYRETEGEYADAARLYRLACDRGRAAACTDVALLAHEGSNVWQPWVVCAGQVLAWELADRAHGAMRLRAFLSAGPG